MDGQLLNTGTNPYDYNNNLPTSGNLYIGSSCGGNCDNFKGKLDEIRIYNKALTAQEISQLYTTSSVQKVNATISIPKGSTSGTIEIKGIDDQTDENNETIISKIISTVGANETGDQNATVVLTDDDNTTVSLSVSSNSITESTNQFATLTATLDKVSEVPVNVFLKSTGVDDSDFRISTSNDTSSAAAQLMAHYTFSGNASDGTSNANNGSVTGATLTTDRFGEANSAYYFDGDGDYISVPFSESLQIEDDITMSLWVYHEDANSYTTRLLYAPNSYYEIYTDERNNGNGFRPRGTAAGWDGRWANNEYNNGEWKMFTLVASTTTSGENTTRKYEWYLDGQLLNTETNPYDYNNNLPTSGNLYIGSSCGGGCDNFKGKALTI